MKRIPVLLVICGAGVALVWLYRLVHAMRWIPG